MGVFDLQRIECPLHSYQSTGQRVVPLSDFEAPAKARVTVLRHDRQHVRVQIRLPVAIPRQRHRKADQAVAVIRPDHLATNFRSDDKYTVWDYVAVAVPPDSKLHFHAALEIRQLRNRSNADLSTCVLHTFNRRLRLAHNHSNSTGRYSARFASRHSSSNCSGVSRDSASYPPATCSILAKRVRNFAFAARSANSGSTLRWRARFTAVNNRSPTSTSILACRSPAGALISARISPISSCSLSNSPVVSGQSKP